MNPGHLLSPPSGGKAFLKNPMLAGLVVVILWASTFPAIQVAAADLGPVWLSFLRLVVAALALGIIAIIKRISLPRFKDLPWILAAGFFGMTAYQLLLNLGEMYVPAGTTSIIVASAPLVSVAVARILFREKITALTVIGSVIALAGVTLVCLSRAGVSLSPAVWIVVAAAITQGIYHPLQRPLLKRHTGLEVATYITVAGTLMSIPTLPFGWEHLTQATPAGLLGAVYLGLIPSALGYVLWARAVAGLPVAVSTSLLYLVPPVAVLMAWAWLGEVPLTAELWGGLVVILGVAVVSQGPRMLRFRQKFRAKTPLEDLG